MYLKPKLSAKSAKVPLRRLPPRIVTLLIAGAPGSANRAHNLARWEKSGSAWRCCEWLKCTSRTERIVDLREDGGGLWT